MKPRPSHRITPTMLADGDEHAVVNPYVQVVKLPNLRGNPDLDGMVIEQRATRVRADGSWVDYDEVVRRGTEDELLTLARAAAEKTPIPPPRKEPWEHRIKAEVPAPTSRRGGYLEHSQGKNQ